MKRQNALGSRPQVLTVREVSEYLRVHPATIYRLVRERRLPAFQVGSEWQFDIDTIDRWSRGRAGSERHPRKGLAGASPLRI
jgi:excisionase family DNA binding protein